MKKKKTDLRDRRAVIAKVTESGSEGDKPMATPALWVKVNIQNVSLKRV